MRDNINSINNFFYFLFNTKMVREQVEEGRPAYYYPQVIMEAEWTCDREHLMSKWVRIFGNNPAIETALLYFYSELDSHNRRIMLEWIEANYDCGGTI